MREGAASLPDPERASQGWERRALRLALLVFPFVLAAALKLPLCPYALVLRYPCPGCGLTRAAVALATGDLAAAMALNPLAPVVCPVAFGFALQGAFGYVAKGRIGLTSPWVMRTVLALCAGLAVVWLARMFGAFGGPVAV